MIRKFNLQQKVLFTCLFLVLVPSFSIGYFSFQKSAQLVESQASRGYYETLRQADINLTYRLQEIENTSDLIYFNDEIQRILRTTKGKAPNLNEIINNYTALSKYIHSVEQNKNIYRLRLFVYGDPLYANERVNLFSMDELQESEFYSQLKANSNQILWDYRFKNELDAPVSSSISMCREIRDLEHLSVDLGVLCIDTDMTAVKGILQDIQLPAGSNLIIYHKNNILLQNEAITDNFSNQADTLDVIKSMNEVEGNSIRSLSGIPYLVINKNIKYVDLGIAALIPINEMKKQSAPIRRFTELLVVIFCLVAIGFAVIFTQQITKGLRRLNQMIVQLELGHFGIISKVVNNDEISQLQDRFNRMSLKIKELIDQVYKITISKQETELRLLQSQINPHFLYNTLDTIKWIAMRNHSKDIVDLVEWLSRFFRLGLNRGKEVITISDEIEIVNNYIQIQQFRFRDKISFYSHMDEAIFSMPIIKLLLQPLIENAIVHGIQRKENGTGSIIIHGYKQADSIVFKVIDDGVGIERHRLTQLLTDESDGYGIKNVNDRIRLAYGESYGVTVYSRPGIGCTVMIVLPITKEEEPL